MGATVPFQILIWITIPAFINVLLAQMLTAMKKQKILIISNGIGFLVNLALGLIFVNTYASVGMCWASLLSYIGLLAGNFYFVFKFLGLIPIHKLLVRPLIAGSIMCISFSLLMDQINVIIEIRLIVLYCGLLFIFKTLTKDEIEVSTAAFLWRFGTRPDRLDST